MAKITNSIQLTQDGRKKLEELAKKYNTSMSEIIEACMNLVCDKGLEIKPGRAGNYRVRK
jgi:predicted transcriptional regulator